MLFLGGGMHGWERSVDPDQHAYRYRRPGVPLVFGHFDPAGWTAEPVEDDYDIYARRPFAAEGRWRNVMVKTDLSDAQAQDLLGQWLVARWVAEAREPEGGVL